ncbi:unnamed protein product [Paramecium sonneborni]|uniref:Poly(A) RNA polymerase mitochondrial-like central palm domain-containing protein n=1 Tax=Paramecium sonneborni TaxID=65129 RepID=A0A8S1Q1S6_9CILI|nr:unnamed protein product [Paramecium sonneborni]
MFQFQEPFEIEACFEQIYQNSLGDQFSQELINDTIISFQEFLNQNELVDRNTKVLLFGSILNGFSTKKSDIDFTITTNSYISEIKVLEYWISQLKYQTRFQIQQNLLHARTPVIKILDSQNLIFIDLCYNNLLGAINTRLLKAYSQLDEKVKKGGILLKMWGKGAKIINNFLFSSYSIIILWLHFLQAKYQLPNLQDQKYNINKIESDLIIKRQLYQDENVITIRTFFLHEDEVYEKVKYEFQKRISQISLKTLFEEFFTYYSQDGYGFNQPYKISINQKELKNQNIKYSMCDPFDPLHDPLLKINNAFKNNKAFSNAVFFLQNKWNVEYLFKEENEQLHY